MLHVLRNNLGDGYKEIMAVLRFENFEGVNGWRGALKRVTDWVKSGQKKSKEVQGTVFTAEALQAAVEKAVSAALGGSAQANFATHKGGKSQGNGGFRKGKGKYGEVKKAYDRDACAICHRRGHWKNECWQNPINKGKGKSKGGKGKGKDWGGSSGWSSSNGGNSNWRSGNNWNNGSSSSKGGDWNR
jgi:hypothetical protein